MLNAVLFLLQAATGGFCATWIDSPASFGYFRNLAVHSDYKRCAIRNTSLRHQNAVQLRDLSFMVAEQRIGRIQLFAPVRQGRDEIRAHRQHLRIERVKFAYTRLVGC